MLNSELKVGLVVLASMFGLVWLTYKSGEITGFEEEKSKRTLVTETRNASGLHTGSKVKIAGVDVGVVRKIRLTTDGSALIYLSVSKSTPLATNVFAKVDSDGLIGSKFISLNSPIYTQEVITSDTTKIPFEESGNIEEIGSTFADIASDLNKVSKSLRDALAGENEGRLERIASSLDSASSRLSNILNEEVEEGKVNTIINNFTSFSEDVNRDSDEILASVKGAAASLDRILNQNEGKASEMFADFSIVGSNLSVITEKLTTSDSTLGRLINEDTEIITNLNKASADFASISDKINSGKGTLGQIINDSSTIDKVNSALASLDGITNRIGQIQTEIDFFGYTLLGQSVTKGSFNVKITTRPNRFYLLGATSDGYAVESEESDSEYFGQDFGKKLKFTAQFGRGYESLIFNNDVDFRVGIKNSTFGFGADMYAMDDRLQLSTDVYDLSGADSGPEADNAHVDMLAKYFFKGIPFYGVTGVDNILNSKYTAPFVGMGIKFGDNDFKYILKSAGAAL
ncbi:MAG: MCE family protein [Proteobacteria bacterium]|nr:MCE family protein [Pseudomonadota bacterium]